MDVSLGKLRQLLTVADTGSFSRAADQLNVSQPALSRAIAALEERYGFPIFNRVGHGVEPTAAGAQIIALARPLLEAMQVFDSNLRLFGSGKAGKLSLGLAPLLASELLAGFAASVLEREGEVQLKVLIRPGNILLEALKRDEIELFFFPDSHIEAVPEIEVVPVGSISPACVVRRGHPLTARRNLTLEDMRDFPWAGSMAPPGLKDFMNPAQFVCDNYHILRDTVMRTDLICICSQGFVARELQDGSICEIVVRDLLPSAVTIHMAKLRGRIVSPLAASALGQISEMLRPRGSLRQACAS